MVSRARPRGMTLMEVMIALALATIGLLGALAMLGTMFRGASYSRNISEAMALVQSKLELEVSRGAITLTSPANGGTTETVMDALAQTSGAGPFLYTRLTTWAPSTDGLRRKVSVDVAFTDNSGMLHHVIAERERNLP